MAVIKGGGAESSIMIHKALLSQQNGSVGFPVAGDDLTLSP